MATITLKFYLASEADCGDVRIEYAEFTACDDMESDIEQWLEDFNADNDGDFEIEDRDITEFDNDYPDPAGFTDLNDYGALVEKVDEYGPAYAARYDDRGDFDWDDEYHGCWDSEEEFVQQMYEDCYEIPDHLQGYVDWEKLTRDVLMDYDSYYVDGEYYIFRA